MNHIRLHTLYYLYHIYLYYIIYIISCYRKIKLTYNAASRRSMKNSPHVKPRNKQLKYLNIQYELNYSDRMHYNFAG